ncbi:hypothetical protein BATDEDRAFT_34519 [Batrachochytrium dendrobatidis JAM81]|uniref:Ras-GAP domain-containing protein n=2 Tax=Batrachochytrium dendrobatidis TaxID=109871 RepID=F4NYD2_BATDJ|nr:uncharacterized protein BATDEDRAFT_34519 [Batrachochytrium dendrobatidis JAM81]EGF81694.1 hypothetical protein BATDEDRAFT_34519 [Batrachochytrium dendrobatidis JAM81]|eukprot:XP_006677392.1 hypothetical protein BATDEDRAFT_34519 [Batrachochytrium dendrobatidis JAM81]
MNDNRLLLALLTRISDKLPVASGLSLSFLSSDPIFIQNISWVYELAPWKIHDIIKGLIGTLDNIIKTEDHAIASQNSQLSYLASQSQLIILKIIANCLARSWSLHRQNTAKKSQPSSSVTSIPNMIALGHDKLRYTESSQSTEMLEFNRSPLLRSKLSVRNTGNSNANPSFSQFSSMGSTSHLASPQYLEGKSTVDNLVDPPRFDEPTAILLLDQALRFYQTPMANINLDTYSHSSVSANSQFSNMESSFEKFGNISSRIGLSSFFKSLPLRMSDEVVIQSLLSLQSLDAESIEFELERTAALVIYYLSASNWGIILARLKSKISSFYSNPSGAGGMMSHMSGSKGDTGDINLADLRMLECCNLDINRLSTALAEITPHLKIFHKKAMAVAVVGVRRAIWNWIEAFPIEFASLLQSRKNLDGHPEVLFDFLHVNADSSRKKNLYWPTQTILLLLSAEDLFAYTNTGSSGASLAKKIQFLESLKKAVKSSRSYDTAVLCYTDLCKAATFASKSDGASLRILVGSFETELKEKLFDPLRSISLSVEDGGTIDEDLLAECLTSLFKLNPLNTLRSVYPVLVEPGVPPLYRILFMKSCANLVADTAPLPWNPPIDVALADYIRHLFLEYVGRDKHGDVKAYRQFLKVQRDRRMRKMQAEETERSEIILNALQCWGASPTLAIVRDTSVITPDELLTMMQAITACLLDPMEAIRNAASQALLRLFDPQFISHWDGCRPDWRFDSDTHAPTELSMRIFWRTSSAVMLSIARQLLDIHAQTDIDVDIVLEIVSLLCDLLFSRNQFLKLRQDSIASSFGCAIQERFAASVSMEISLLFLICSPEQAVFRVATVCFQRLVEEAEITGEANDLLTLGGAGDTVPWLNASIGNLTNNTESAAGPKTSSASLLPGNAFFQPSATATAVGFMPVFPIVLNLAVYRGLSNLFDGSHSEKNILIMGNKAQQKALRKILQLTERPTPGNLGAWEEVYRRWHILSQNILKMNIPISSPINTGGLTGPGDKLISAKLNIDDEEESVKIGRYARLKGSIRVGNEYTSTGMPGSTGTNQGIRSGSDLLFGIGEDQAEWHNYTGFLCSLGNVCLLASQQVISTSVNPSSGANILGNGVSSFAPAASSPSSSLQPSTNAPSNPQTVGLASPSTFSGSHSGGLDRILTLNKSQMISAQPARVSSLLGSAEKPKLNSVVSSDDTPVQPNSLAFGNAFSDSNSAQAESLAAINWGTSVNSQLTVSYSRAKQTVERFVRELVELMIHTGPVIRDTVRELLATEASGGLYAILFMYFERSLTSIFSTGAQDICSERNVILIETIVIITRSVLDRSEDLYSENSGAGETGTLSSAVQLSLYSIDFAWIIIHLAKFVNRMAIVPSQALSATRIKIRICQLLEHLHQRRGTVGIKQDVLFRNHMVQVLLEWNSEFSIKTSDQSQHQPMQMAEGMMKINAELDGMTIMAIVSLLDGLPLVPVNESNGVLIETDDDEENNAKSKLFSTNLTFFLKVLQTCKVVEGIDSVRQQISPELRILINKSKESAQHLSLLKDNTILALSNLISANIKAGLKYSLSIAYYDDTKTRAAFMHVLANILDGGSVSGLLNGEWHDNKYTKLLELLTDDELAIVLTLCDVTSSNDIDDIATALLDIFEKFGKASKLISTVIEDEIQHTDVAAGIFRRNSIATKLLTLYARNEAQDFLYVTLRPIIRTLSEMNPPLSFEIDPSRVDQGENLSTNMSNLRSVTQDFLTNIFGNVAHFPVKLRLICAKVSESVTSKFPSAGLLGVGAFVFLRFICPAIVAPEAHNLTRTPIHQKELRRGLILITKVVQNLANCVLFGAKEAFMISLNGLLETNQDAVRAFLSEISTSVSPDRSIDDLAIAVQTEELTARAVVLHRQLENYYTKMERSVTTSVVESQSIPNVSKYGTFRGGKHFSLSGVLETESCGDDNGSVDDLNGPLAINTRMSSLEILAPHTISGVGGSPNLKKAALDQLSIILAQLGPAPLISDTIVFKGATGGHLRNGSISESGHLELMPKDASTRSNTSKALQEFMRRQAALPTKPSVVKYVKEQRVFYESGTSIDGRPVLYFIVCKVQPESIDMSMLIHVLIEQCANLITKPFDLLVDLSFAGREHQWQLETLHTLEKMFPIEARQNLHTIFFLHANTYFKVMAKHAPRLLHSRMAKRTVFCSSIKDLYEFIAKEKLHLPKTTLNIYDHELTTFTQTQVHLFKGSSIGVTLSISQSVLILLMAKKQELMGLQPPIVDIFHVSDIRDVGVSCTDPKNSDTEFYVKFHEKHGTVNTMQTGNATIIYLSSPRRDTILQVLRSAVARFQLSRPPVNADERNVSPRDLPGTLLNIAFLNLCSEEPALRVASYDLLCAIVNGFGFNAGVHLHSTKGLAIPFNSHRFVQDISTALAKSEIALTFEFVAEGLLGYSRISRELQMHMLNYILPWLPNLVVYLTPTDSIQSPAQVTESRNKVIQVLTSLIHLTLKERENFLAIQTYIWSVLGQHELLIPFIIDLFIDTAKQLPFGASETEVLANTLITLAARNGHIVAGLIIKALRQALTSTAIKPRTSIVDHTAWPLVQVLLRFVLMLSFDDKLCLQLYIADLFHALTLVVGLGSPILRRTIHGIIMNTLQILLSSAGRSETSISGLHVALDKFHDPKYARLFGLSTQHISSTMQSSTSFGRIRPDQFRHFITPAFVFNSETVQGELVRDLALPDIDFFVSTLIDIVSYGASSVEVCATWKTRWISLAARSAFEDNFTAQTRSFIMIGSLAKEGFDSDLLYQTLVALRSALLRFEDNKPHLVQSVVMCLCNSLYSAPAHEHIIVPLFWLGIGLVQVGYIPFFHSGLDLLNVVLRLVEENPKLRGTTLTKMLLNGRVLIHEEAVKLDHETQIYFGEYLSFSIAGTLLKGICNPALKQRTTKVLSMLLQMSSVQSDTIHASKSTTGDPAFPPSHDAKANNFAKDSLGYVIALLPTSERPDALLSLAGITRYENDGDSQGEIDDSGGSEEFLSGIQQPVSAFSAVGKANAIGNGSDNLIYGGPTWRNRLLKMVPLDDPTVSALMLGLLQVLLQASEFEPEMLQIYRLLAAIACQSPTVFYPLYVRLISRLSNIMLTTKSPQLSYLVHAIFQSMATHSGLERQGPQSTNIAIQPISSSHFSLNQAEDLGDIIGRNGLTGLLTALSPEQQLSKITKMRRVMALCEIINLIDKTASF